MSRLIQHSFSAVIAVVLSVAMVATGMPVAMLGSSGVTIDTGVEPAFAADPTTDTPDATGWSTDGTVWAAEVGDDGTTYIGGDFGYIGPMTGGATKVDEFSGVATQTTAFIGGNVEVTIPDGAGGYYVGGQFETPLDSVAHVLPDGSLDTSFTGPAIAGTVNALETSGTTLFVGGSFTSAGRANIMALDATGTVIPWNPAGGANAPVSSLEVTGTDLYAGGSFTTIGGVGRNRVASLDTSSAAVTAWDPDSNGPVLSLEATGTLMYAGGAFATIGGAARTNIAALDASIGATGTANGWYPDADGAVVALDIDGDEVYAGGAFANVGGVPRARLAALDASAGSTGTATAWDPGADATVWAVCVDGSNVYAGGDFTTLGGAARNNLGAVDAGTGLATAWDPDPNDWVRSITCASDPFVGGYFDMLGGVRRNNLAALDPATGLPTAWDPDVTGDVYALEASGTTLYAGGSFSAIGGIPRTRLGAVSTTSSAPTSWTASANNTVRALEASGPNVWAGGLFTMVGGAPNPNIVALDSVSASVTASPGASNHVLALQATDSTVYAGGRFTAIGGAPRRRIAALDASTGAATSWDPDSDGRVRRMALDGDSIYVVGTFSEIGGQFRDAIAEIDVATGDATAWDPAPNTGDMYSIVKSDSTVYAAGDFTRIGGATRTGLAALDADTGAATGWDPDVQEAGAPGFVYDMAVGPRLTIGGFFTHVAGERHHNLASFPLAPETDLDVMPPMPDGMNGWWVTQPTATLSISIPGTTYYQWDGMAPGSWSTYMAPLGADEGTHTLNFFSVSSIDETETPVQSATFQTDTEGPIGPMNVDDGSAATTSTAVSVDSTMTDSASGVDVMRINTGGGFGDWMPYAASVPATLTGGDGTKVVTVDVRDRAGNVTTLLDTIVLDTTAPTGSMVLNGGDTYTMSTAVTVDSLVSGATEMRIDTGSGWSAWMPFVASMPATLPAGDGTKNVDAEYRDAAGNMLALSDSIILDTVPPFGTMAVNQGAPFTTSTTVSIDSTVTGATQMRVNTGLGFGAWIPYNATVPGFLLPPDGPKLVTVEYEDDSGHMLTLFDTITLDTSEPTGTVVIDGDATYTTSTDVTIDSLVSGATEMRFDNGDGFGVWMPFAASYPATLPAGDGVKNVDAEYRDDAGNTIALSDSIILDTTPPSGTMAIDQGASHTTTVTVSVDSTVTGATEMRVNVGDGFGAWMPYAASVPATLPGGDGVKTVDVEYRDDAGNTLALFDTITLDSYPPFGSMVINDDAMWSNEMTVTVDSDVGNATEMRVDPGTGFGPWELYADDKQTVLPSGDGTKTVVAEYRSLFASPWQLTDDIVLDQTDPIDPSIDSTSHVPWSWSTTDTVDITLSGATDNLSGVDGFGVTWSMNATETPPQVKTNEETQTAFASPPLASGPAWYINVATVDNAGNWTTTVHMGPFLIDTTPPPEPEIESTVLPRSEWDDVWVNQPLTLVVTAEDPESGITQIDWERTDPPPGSTSSGTEAGSATTFTVSANGVTAFAYSAVNFAGSRSVTGTAIAKVDQIVPVTTSDATDRYDDMATITLTPTDAGGSGIDATYYSVDGAPAKTYATPIKVSDLGDHTLEFWSEDAAGNIEVPQTVSFLVRAAVVDYEEIAGATRYDTAIAASKKAYPNGADVVIVATGENWPDALGGSALAGAVDGPILLTPAAALPNTVAGEIARLGADEAIILGGTGAVSPVVANALAGQLGGTNVTRIGGSDRYVTAELVARATATELGAAYDGTCFIATGLNFPDALGASPLAAAGPWPIFLAPPTGITPSTASAMSLIGVDEALILGGTGVVSNAIEGELAASLGAANVARLAGPTRYETAVVVATYGVDNAELGWNFVALATGENFPDALAGGVLQGKTGSVMLLTPTNSLYPDVAAKLAAERDYIGTVRFLGGPGAVSPAVRTQVAQVLQ